MPTKILVTYATRYGSTQEVAERVAAVLRECGLTVEMTTVKDVRSLGAYDAVVLGAPIYIGHLRKEARQFLANHADMLAQRKVAIFALGPFHSPIDEKEWQYSREQLDKELAQFPWLTPVALELFGGKMDPAKLRFPYNLPASPLKQMPATDIRDWTAIRAWASDLAAQFQPALA